MVSNRPFVLDFDLISGFCESGSVQPAERRISNLAQQFSDQEAAQALIKNGDPLLYKFYGLDLPSDDSGVLQFGTTILYPGKVGNEYYMTSGHFHVILDTSEVYYCLRGRGMMLMETPEGDVETKELIPGSALYVPGRWAHRSINTGDEPLILFFVYRGDAGHDYGTIKEKGYRKIVVEEEGRPVLVDNPKWGAARP